MLIASYMIFGTVLNLAELWFPGLFNVTDDFSVS